MARKITAATIRTRIRKLEIQARNLERSATKGLRAAAAVISKYGLTLTDLKQAFALNKGRNRRPVPAKYRDSKGNTWTGRGRPPLWLVAAEQAGQKRESFLIDSKRPAKAVSRRKSTNRKKPAARRAAPKKMTTASGVAAALG